MTTDFYSVYVLWSVSVLGYMYLTLNTYMQFLAFEANLQVGSTSRIDRSRFFLAVLSAVGVKKVWTLGGKGIVSSVHCLF